MNKQLGAIFDTHTQVQKISFYYGDVDYIFTDVQICKIYVSL